MKRNMLLASLVANLLDNRFSLFGVRFGISALIDLIPGVGDALDLILACYLIGIAIHMRLPRARIMYMVWNIIFSFLIGLLPIIGDAMYIFYRPNIRNLAILKEYDKTI